MLGPWRIPAFANHAITRNHLRVTHLMIAECLLPDGIRGLGVDMDRLDALFAQVRGEPSRFRHSWRKQHCRVLIWIQRLIGVQDIRQHSPLDACEPRPNLTLDVIPLGVKVHPVHVDLGWREHVARHDDTEAAQF